MRLSTLVGALAPALLALTNLAAARDAFIGGFNQTASAVDPVALKARAVGDAPALDKRGYAGVQAYHDATSAQHQDQFNRLAGLGWRMISLSVSGATTDPRYAAVWALDRAGPSWMAIHDAPAARFQAFYDQYVAQGYVPTLLSVAGGNDATAVFAAVLEKADVGNWQLWYGQSADQAAQQINAALAGGLYLKALALYGAPDPALRQTRYAMILHQNRAGKQWDWYPLDLSDALNRDAPSLQAQGQPGGPGGVPAVVAGNAGNVMTFSANDPPHMPNPYQWGGGRSSADYQNYFNQMAAQGWCPYQVAVSSVGSDSMYWSLWTK